MRKVKVKQGTLAWEKLRETRIGSSEVFDIVRYYATDEELQNCGINSELFREEKPYTTAWALYHKLKKDGLFHRKELEPELAEYGHKVEPYGIYDIEEHRQCKIKAGEVLIDDNLICSLDSFGIAEEWDTLQKFVNGFGSPKIGQKFVMEQKSMMPNVIKKGIPYKYIVQAQYQTLMAKADFFILQIMVLDEDTAFIRGKICEKKKKALFNYLDENMTVYYYYFRHSYRLSNLIGTCLKRFFDDVEKNKEPKPYIDTDSQENIIESIRLNSQFNENAVINYDLTNIVDAKTMQDKAKDEYQAEMQKIVSTAFENNACKFASEDGTTAKFSKNGRLLVKEAK